MNTDQQVVVVDPVKVVKIQLITTVCATCCKPIGCCWPCKGSKNSANHNPWSTILSKWLVVVDPVKVVKIQLITTSSPWAQIRWRCCWPCKGSKNSANHNPLATNTKKWHVVVDPVKVVKIQLITTIILIKSGTRCCCWPCKGSKNSANHNGLSDYPIVPPVVVDPVKVVKIQLITTIRASKVKAVRLLLTL